MEVVLLELIVRQEFQVLAWLVVWRLGVAHAKQRMIESQPADFSTDVFMIGS